MNVNMDLIIGLVVGLVIGAGLLFLILRVTASKSSAVKKLEQEHAKYREGVDAHFVKTAGLFKNLTDQYRDVYQHMAQGADQLCSDEVKTLQSDLAETGLLSQEQGTKQGTEDKQDAIGEAVSTPVVESNTDKMEQDEPADGLKEDYPLASEVELPAVMLGNKEHKE